MCRELHTNIYIYSRETCVENYIQLLISTQERHVQRTAYNYLYLPKRDMCRELHTTINIYPREKCVENYIQNLYLPKRDMCRELHTNINIYPRETCVENYIQLSISTQERHV
jgi:hypothetical protein